MRGAAACFTAALALVSSVASDDSSVPSSKIQTVTTTSSASGPPVHHVMQSTDGVTTADYTTTGPSIDVSQRRLLAAPQDSGVHLTLAGQEDSDDSDFPFRGGSPFKGNFPFTSESPFGDRFPFGGQEPRGSKTGMDHFMDDRFGKESE